MRPHLHWLAMMALVTVAPARADDALRAARARAAQVVTLAKMAPIVCPGIETDAEGLAAFMEHTQVTLDDIRDPNEFGPADEEIAESFAQSVRENQALACTQLYGYFGEGGAKLLRHKPGRPG